jgi:Fe-S cluster biogenesis protein NfuA
MAHGANVRQAGDQIEQLLGEVRSMVSPATWDRIDRLVRSIVELYGAGLAQLMNALDAPGADASTVRQRLLADPLIASLLLLHGLHPDDLATRVQQALERVRPYLGSHGGDVEVVATDEDSGVVRLRMKGSCDGCPSSILTVKLAVETAIREAAPEVIRVDVQELTDHQSSAASAAPANSSGASTAGCTMRSSV